MKDIIPMKIINRLHSLHKYSKGLYLSKFLVMRLKVKEVSLVCVLHYQVDLVLVLQYVP